MSIENADYIHQLDSTAPRPVDPISEGDNHIRLIKKLLTQSFPSDLDGVVVPDVSDNEEKYLRVNEDGTAIEWHQIQVQGVGIIPFRSLLSYKDDSTIILGPGEYTHKDQSGTLSWTEDKELTINNPSGDFAYIYLNNSGTVTPSWSENHPTWSNAARGWYLDDKRCIGAVPTENGNGVKKFYHDGADYFSFGDSPWAGELSSSGNNYKVIDFSNVTPKFSDFINVHFHFISPSGASLSCQWYGKPHNEEGEVSLTVTQASNSGQGEQHTNFISKFKTVDGKIDVKGVSQHSHKVYYHSLGYYLPRGI